MLVSPGITFTLATIATLSWAHWAMTRWPGKESDWYPKYGDPTVLMIKIVLCWCHVGEHLPNALWDTHIFKSSAHFWRSIHIPVPEISLSPFFPPGSPSWLRWQRICLQCSRPGFDPWVRKIPWRREWQPTLVFLPEKSRGQRSLVVYSPWGHRVRHDWATNRDTFFPQSYCFQIPDHPAKPLAKSHKRYIWHIWPFLLLSKVNSEVHCPKFCPLRVFLLPTLPQGEDSVPERGFSAAAICF